MSCRAGAGVAMDALPADQRFLQAGGSLGLIACDGESETREIRVQLLEFGPDSRADLGLGRCVREHLGGKEQGRQAVDAYLVHWMLQDVRPGQAIPAGGDQPAQQGDPS